MRRILFFILLICFGASAPRIVLAKPLRVIDHAAWTPRMEALARRTEVKCDLPRGFCQAFARVESRYDATALRVHRTKAPPAISLRRASMVRPLRMPIGVPHVEVSRWNGRMDSLARWVEEQNGFPRGMARAFALQESTYDSNAVRVEVGYFNDGSRYWKKIADDSRAYLGDTANHALIPLSIERSQRSESFGLFQIMGQNYRVMGYAKEFIQPTLQEQFEYFGKFVAPLWKKYHSLAIVASVYNSGQPTHASGSYAKNIVKYQKQFSH